MSSDGDWLAGAKEAFEEAMAASSDPARNSQEHDTLCRYAAIQAQIATAEALRALIGAVTAIPEEVPADGS